jgi:hypothetical protein
MSASQASPGEGCSPEGGGEASGGLVVDVIGTWLGMEEDPPPRSHESVFGNAAAGEMVSLTIDFVHIPGRYHGSFMGRMAHLKAVESSRVALLMSCG